LKNLNYKPFILILFLIVGVLSIANIEQSSASPIQYVNGNYGNDSYDGTSPTFISGYTGPKKTITESLYRVDSGGKIYLAKGTYKEHLNIGKNVIIIGENKYSTKIDGSNTGRVIFVNKNTNVKIYNCTIQRGKGTSVYEGGGIYNKGIMTIKNCIVQNNTAKWTAGGIYSTGTMVINSCIIRYNKVSIGESSVSGVANGGKSMTIINSTIERNTNGAGIFSNNGYLTISNCKIRYNIGKFGGGVTNFGGTVSITKSLIAYNIATCLGGSDGGGVYSGGYLTKITYSTIYKNTAKHYGGGIFAAGGTLIIYKSKILYNTAKKGKGIYKQYGKAIAKYNWWGYKSPRFSTLIRGSVVYKPWLKKVPW
jgi:predicted outer membrane repeat protein